MSQIRSQERRNRKKSYNPYNLYVPENLDIDDFLRNHPPLFKRRPKRYINYRDAIIYIAHLLSSIPNFQKDFDFEETNGFIPIHKETLRNRIHEYRAYIDYLVAQQVIEEGTNYIVGKRSMGLRFTKKYITKVAPIKIFSSTLIKSIVKGQNNRDIEAEAKLSFMANWFNQNLTIDYKNALEFLEEDKEKSRQKIIKKREQKNYSETVLQKIPTIEEIVLMGYNSKFITVDRINNADYKGYPKVDLTTGRMHSPLTQLKKGLRKYLKYREQGLCCIDIINSQPLLTLIIIDIDIFHKMNIGRLIAKYNEWFKPNIKYDNNNKEYKTTSSKYYTMLVKLINNNRNKNDVIAFRNSVIAGHFYEMFSSILLTKNLIPEEILSITDDKKKNEAIRDFAKKATFRAFFEKVQAARWCKYVSAFKTCFPNVYSIFQLVKKGNGKHNTLALILQRFESHIILHRICCDINANHPHVPLFTIHDSICTTIQYQEIVYTFLAKHLKEILGIEPKLKIEIWE